MPFFLADTSADLRAVDRTSRIASLPGTQTLRLSTPRQEIYPPQLYTRSQPAWRRWAERCWARLVKTGGAEDVPWQPMVRIQAARDAFFLAASDLCGEQAQDLRERIGRARSLRELWHLRLDLFNLLSRARGQLAAEAQMQALNDWFPQRVPQSSTSPGRRVLR
ncbi:MAG: hypothetical protein ACOZD0_13455 [Pseudomonadota bacterium]